ncbi:hypothetical protein Hdeb2414_s0100g00793281 [Helianthus debilis subsp. tardiflorus]
MGEELGIQIEGSRPTFKSGATNFWQCEVVQPSKAVDFGSMATHDGLSITCKSLFSN